MNLTFEYPVLIPDGKGGEKEEILEIEVEIIQSGIGNWEHFGNKGNDSGPEIDLISFSQVGLNVEQIKYIEDYIIDSDALITRIWDEYDRNS